MQINSIGYTPNFGTRKDIQKSDYVKMPYGADYEVLDVMDLKDHRLISEINDDYKAGKDISEDRDRLIYSRMPSAQRDAARFVEENPQFEYDDVLQGLACLVVRNTDSDIGRDNGLYGQYYARDRQRYFKNLKETNAQEEDMQQTLYAKYVPSDMEKDVQIEMLKEKLHSTIDSTLTPREQLFVSLYFGLEGDEPMKIDEIAKAQNTTRERVRQVLVKSLRKLSYYKRSDEFRPMLDMYA